MDDLATMQKNHTLNLPGSNEEGEAEVDATLKTNLLLFTQVGVSDCGIGS